MNSFSRRIFLLLVISSLILGLVTYTVSGNVQKLLAENTRIIRSDALQMKLGESLSEVRAASNFAFSYLLTGNAAYLGRYKTFATNAAISLAELPAAMGEDKQQVGRAQMLVQLQQARLALIEKALATNERGGNKAAFALLNSGMDPRDAEQALALAGQIQTTEQEKLTNVHDVIAERQFETGIISAGGAAGCFAIFLFLFWLIEHEGLRRSRTERSLQGVVKQMEQIQGEMTQLGQLSDYLQSCRELEEIYGLVSHHIATLLPETHGFFGMFNNSRNVIEVVTHWGAGYRLEAHKYFMPEDCWALRRGVPHFVDGKTGDPCCGHSPLAAASLCIPLVAHGETLGMIYLAARSVAELDAHTQQLVRRVGEHVSMAVANMKLEKTLRMQSVRDPMTQLFNRRYMETSLEREILRAKRKNEPVSVIMIDVDHFKTFNDNFGHESGDHVLKEFAKLALRTIRAEDIACRYGGEEFILILPGASIEIAEQRAGKLRSEMAAMELAHHGKALGKVTISLGIATYPLHSDQQSQLIKKADEALYQAKHRGRDCVVVAPVLNALAG